MQHKVSGLASLKDQQKQLGVNALGGKGEWNHNTQSRRLGLVSHRFVGSRRVGFRLVSHRFVGSRMVGFGLGVHLTT